MSMFRKILAKLGLRKDQEKIVVTGTAEVAPPDPLSTKPVTATKTVSQGVPVPRAARPDSPAPTSDLDFKDNSRNSGEKAK